MKGSNEGRLHSAVLVSPRRERRSDRRARKAAAKSLLAEDRDTRRAAAKVKFDELLAERRATVVMPKAGEPGPGDYGARSLQRSVRRVPVMPPEVIRTLPFGTALVLLRSAPPLVTDLRPWTARPEADQLHHQRSAVETALQRR